MNSESERAAANARFLARTIVVGGVERRYAVYVPGAYDAARRWPMIVFLNGRGECGTDGEKQATQGLGNAIRRDPAAWPFVCVFPQKPDADSAWVDHEALVLGVMEASEREFAIDGDRVYLTGLSQGGRGAWFLGTRHAARFSAIAPICGFGASEDLGRGVKGLAIWAFHGEADEVIKADESRRLANAAGALGADVKLTLYPGVGHNSWDRAYQEEGLAEWFLRHRRRVGGSPP